MKRCLYTAISLLMVVFLSGCIQDTIIIHVKPDGSGTIEETSLLSNNILDLMESIAGNMAGTGEEAGQKDNKDSTEGSSKREEKWTREDVIAKMLKGAEKRAGTFGDAVKFISAKPVKTGTASGYTAVYAFQDISRVKINQNPSTNIEVQKGQENGSPREEYLLFKFTKGPPAKLIVTLPSEKDTTGEKSSSPDSNKALKDESNSEASGQAPEMMKDLFQDMKLLIVLQFEGTILKTNATYWNGSRVTLIEMDFRKIMGNATLFKQLLALNPQSIGETRASFKSVEGLKFETNNPLTVEFK
jgi:hypothetical protein